jgi:parvulin-like peptidyl-prolyl isomerase
VRLQGRIRVTEDDLRSSYRRLVLEERERLSLRVAWVVVPIKDDQKGQRALAERVATAARTTDFGELARRYSEDPSTKDQGGVMPATMPEQLPPVLHRAVSALEAGEASPVLVYANAYVIVKVLARQESQLPAYNEARQELSERVYVEKMNQARRNWLDNLRRQHHVEVRL